MTSTEAIVLVIVAIVCVVIDALIVYQIRRGESFAFSSQKWEAPQRRSRTTTPRAFWLVIGMQALVANGVLLYLLWFALSTM